MLDPLALRSDRALIAAVQHPSHPLLDCPILTRRVVALQSTASPFTINTLIPCLILEGSVEPNRLAAVSRQRFKYHI